MRAGELRQRVTIQEGTGVQDDYGSEVIIWADVATVWAAIDDSGGGERFIGQVDQRIAERLTRIKIRYRGGLTVKMRIVQDGQIYDIKRIERDPTLQWQLILWCSEVNPLD